MSILGALLFLERDRRAVAAALLAFAASFKFFPIIFLVPFIFRRDFRFLLYAALACGVLLVAVPCLLLGIGGTLNFYSALLDLYRHFDWVIANYNSQHFPHVLLRLLHAAGFDASAHLPLLRWASYGIASSTWDLSSSFSALACPTPTCGVFTSSSSPSPSFLTTSWPVDLVYLPFGQALLVWKVLEGDHALSWKHPSPIANSCVASSPDIHHHLQHRLLQTHR